MQKALSTGDVAKACQVCQRTVLNWINAGLLKSYRIPGSGAHRRVLLCDLEAFVTKHGMPAAFVQAAKGGA